MPYRNALRDNWRRHLDTQDAEMRMYAQDMMRQAQPQGMYAASEAGALSMDDIGYDAQGNMIILSDQQAPVYSADTRIAMPPRPTQTQQGATGYNPQAGLSAIERRRRELAQALQDY